MKHTQRFALLALLALAGGAQAQIHVGDRVFIPMYSEHLREDGYATGIVQALEGEKAVVIIRELVPGKGKTLYGTCHPGANSPLSGAEVLSDDSHAPILRKTFAVSELKDWRKGKDEYLERENVGTILYKWLSDGMAVTPERARLGATKARSLGLPRVAQALELAAVQIDSTGGMGFPVGAQQLMQGAPRALAAVLEQGRSDSAAAEVMRAIIEGSQPMNGEDVLGMAMAKVLLIVRDAWARLPNEFGGTARASQWGEAKAIAEAYVDALTSGGSMPYAGRDAVALKAELVKALQAGRWPELPAGAVSSQMNSPFEGRTQPISG
ncbi:MAG: hypothetical protein ABWU16_02455 [Halothiobacillaceae bacterium]